jgi:hypothetical protein
LSKAFSSKTNSLSFTLKWASWARSLNFATQKEGPRNISQTQRNLECHVVFMSITYHGVTFMRYALNLVLVSKGGWTMFYKN